jgi:hypothetical protein
MNYHMKHDQQTSHCKEQVVHRLLLPLCIIVMVSHYAYGGVKSNASLPRRAGTSTASETSPQFRASFFDELVPLYPDSAIASPATTYALETARGTTASVHILLKGLTVGRELSFHVTQNDQAVHHARLCQLIAVPVEENTGLDSRTERFTKQPNPYVIRKAPFDVYEAIKPIGRTVTAPSTTFAARLNIPIDAQSPSGRQPYTIMITTGEQAQQLTFIVNVHPVVVAPGNHPDALKYTNWFSLQRMASDHRIDDIWSEPYWAMLDRYAKCMAAGKQNMFWVPLSSFCTVDSQAGITLNRTRLVRYVNLFLNNGMRYIEGGQLARRPNGDWSSPVIELSLTKTLVNTDQGRQQLQQIASQLMAVIVEHQWQEIWYQHISDEPTDNMAEDYKQVARQLNTHMPGVKIFEASMSTRLTDAIDAWCPQVQEYQRHQAFFESRKQAGDTVWIYTCLIPGGPWLNRLLDQERLRPVYVGWSCAKYQLDGFLHWGLNHHAGQPFTQSVRKHGPNPEDDNYLPAGDTHIIFPGEEGPLSSVRFEAHRIGMEDYQLLKQLQTRNKEKADAIIAAVFTDNKTYVTDVRQYRKTKAALLATLSSCASGE